MAWIWLPWQVRSFCYATPAIGNGSGHPGDPGSSASWTILARLGASWSYNQSFLTTLWHIITIHIYICIHLYPSISIPNPIIFDDFTISQFIFTISHVPHTKSISTFKWPSMTFPALFRTRFTKEALVSTARAMPSPWSIAKTSHLGQQETHPAGRFRWFQLGKLWYLHVINGW